MTALDFHITTAQVGGESFVICLGGEVDLHRAAELERGFDSIPDEATLVVVDCGGVSFLDSSALGVLTHQAKRLRAAGGDLVIVSDDPRIVRTFEVTGLDRLFRIERSLGEVLLPAARLA